MALIDFFTGIQRIGEADNLWQNKMWPKFIFIKLLLLVFFDCLCYHQTMLDQKEENLKVSGKKEDWKKLERHLMIQYNYFQHHSLFWNEKPKIPKKSELSLKAKVQQIFSTFSFTLKSEKSKFKAKDRRRQAKNHKIIPKNKQLVLENQPSSTNKCQAGKVNIESIWSKQLKKFLSSKQHEKKETQSHVPVPIQLDSEEKGEKELIIPEQTSKNQIIDVQDEFQLLKDDLGEMNMNSSSTSLQKDESEQEKQKSQQGYSIRTRSQTRSNLPNIERQMKILERLKSHHLIGPFLTPVNQVRDQAPNYYKMIKNPMDLQTIESKAKRGEYRQFSKFNQDMERMWQNSFQYNKRNKYMIRATHNLRRCYLGLVNTYMQRKVGISSG